MKARAWWKPATRAVLLLGVLAVGGLVVADRWSEVSGRLSRLGVGPMAGGLALVAVAEVAAMMSWRAVLGDLGSSLPVRGAARIVYLSALGKYLPGSIWPYLAQVEMSRRYGVPRVRSAAVSVLSVLIGMITGLVIAAATMPWTSPGATRRYWPVFLAVPVLAALLHPRVVNRLMTVALRIIRRPPPDHEVTWAGIAAGAGWSGLNWLASGLQIWVFGAGVAHLRGGDVALCVGGYALAWSAGFLVVIAPAGAGIREAALTAALSPVMPTAAALSVALLSRAATTVGDVGAAVIGGLLAPGRDSPEEGDPELVVDVQAPPGT